MSLSSTAILWLSFAVSLVPILITYLAILRLRQRAVVRGERPSPSRLLLNLGLFFGGIGGALFTLVLGDLIPLEEPWETAFTGPLFEELGKSLLLLAVFATRGVHNRSTGIALGLVGAAGFAAAENLLFTVHGYATGGEDAWFTAVFVRLVFGTILHLTATGLAGAVIADAAPSASNGRRVVAVLVAFATAWTVHGLWNLSVYQLPFAPLWGVLSITVLLAAGTLFGWLYVNELRRPS